MRRSSSPDVVGRLATLRARRDADAGARCSHVRTLVVVCSSSRGGSSLFGELLRRCAGLLHFSAEINPHVVIATLGTGEDASLTPDLLADPFPVASVEPNLAILRSELALDVGRAAPAPPAGFADHVAWRLTMQWPHEAIDPDAVARWTDDVLREHGWHGREAFFADLLPRVRAVHPTVEPSVYDAAANAPGHSSAAPAPPRYRPRAPVIEMAPFVLPRPWAVAEAADLTTTPVVTTTPRNAFRLPLLRAAFPNARVRVVHLVRNPAAAVNGLVDGWLHPGFASVPVPGGLQLDGYTGVHPDGNAWWSFDVPPGWEHWTRRALVEVCAFQWRSAHEATLDAVERMRFDCHRIRFEDVVGPAEARAEALDALASWLGLDAGDRSALTAAPLPVVMATQRPRPARWRSRAAALAPVLADPGLLDLAVRLGYEPDPRTWR